MTARRRGNRGFRRASDPRRAASDPRRGKTSFCAWTATPSHRAATPPSFATATSCTSARETIPRPRRAVAPLASRRRRRPGRHAGPERRDGETSARAARRATRPALARGPRPDPRPVRRPRRRGVCRDRARDGSGFDPVEARGEKRSNARARCAKYGTPMNVETRPSAKKSATEEGKEEEAARRRARANKPTETGALRGLGLGVGWCPRRFPRTPRSIRTVTSPRTVVRWRRGRRQVGCRTRTRRRFGRLRTAASGRRKVFRDDSTIRGRRAVG